MSNNTIVKASIGYTVANYLIKGLAFFTLPVFTRLLSTEDFGLYNTFLAYENILSILLCFSLYASFNSARFKFENIERYISCCITFSILLSLFTFIFLQLAYPIYESFLDWDRRLVALLVVFSLSSAFVTFYNVFVGLFYQYKKFIVVSAIGAVGNVSISLLLISSFFSNNRGVGRIVGMCIPSIILGCFIVFHFFRKNHPNLDKSYLRYALVYCFPIIPHSLSQIVLSQFDRIMITSMVGKSESGIYSFAYTLFSILLITFSSLDKVWSPWFFDNMKAGKYQNIKKRSTQYGILMGALSIGLMYIAPEVIKFLGPSSYRDSIYIVFPIIIAGFFSFLYYIPCQVEYYFAKTKFIALGSISAALINIILNIIFIRKYGYVAAAYTTLASYLLYFIFHYFVSIQILKKCLFDTPKLVLLSLSVILFGVIALLLVNQFVLRYAFLIFFIGCISICLYKCYGINIFNLKKLFFQR